MTPVARPFETKPAIDSFATLTMVGLTFAWGFNQVLIKLVNVGYNPVLAVTLRSAIACFLVWLWCSYRRIPLFEKDGTLLAGIAAGVLFGVEFILMFIGLDHTTAARGVLLINTMPFWVLLGAHFTLGERLTVRKVWGLALAFLGMMLVFSDKLSLPDTNELRGDLMCLAAGILWAATILVVKGSRLTSASAEKTLIYQLFVSTIFCLPLVPLAGPMLRDISALSTAALLFQATFVVSFTFVLWFWLMRRYPAAGLSSFTFLTPVFGVLCGGLLLNEPLSINVVAALALIVAGLFVVNWQPRRTLPA